MKFRIKIKDKEHKIEIFEQNQNKIKIRVDQKEFIFEEKKDEEFSIAKTSFPKRNFSQKEIKAPIAGTISEIFIKEKEFIKKGQKVVLLSAMKMENEIISEFKGRVKEILTQKNQEVKEGEVLVIIE